MMMTVRSPYLIQRAEINTPLAPTTTRLSQAVNFDYMGSAEFEFGALPESFRRIEAHADAFIMRKVPEIMEGEAVLRVWSYLTNEEFAEYVPYLLALRASRNDHTVQRPHTKEDVHFEVDYNHGKFSRTNFWWDITNDTMFGFKKEFMNRLDDYVAWSLVYMNEQKAKRGEQ